MKTLTFGNVELIDYSCYFDGSDSFRIPEKDIETFSVEGMNGDLSIDHGRYMNQEIPVDCFITKDFRKNYIALINRLSALEGYQRLMSDEEPDVYRLAMFNESISPDVLQADRGMFTLSFNCKPQKYLLSGEQPIEVSSTATLINPTEMPAKPLLICDGTGDITINDTTITLSANTSEVYIDCDIQDAWEGTINRNPDISLTNGFPVLGKENTVSVSGMTVQIIPRWWRL